MGKIVSLIGGFGAALALLGALVALFTGGLGLFAGVEVAEATVGRSVLGIFAALTGFVGAAVARTRPRVGGGVLAVSAVAGLLAVLLFYAVGAVLLLIGAWVAFLDTRTDGGTG